MLPQKEVERFQHRSNLRDVAVAEREIVLTYALQIVHEARLGERLAFKGGTCIRKVHMGSSGRFSMALDDETFRIARDRRSFTVRPRYRHPWRRRPSGFDFQVSLRAEAILPPRRMRLLDPGYTRQPTTE